MLLAWPSLLGTNYKPQVFPFRVQSLDSRNALKTHICIVQGVFGQCSQAHGRIFGVVLCSSWTWWSWWWGNCVILYSTQKLQRMIENQVFRQGLQTSLTARSQHLRGRQMMVLLSAWIPWTGSWFWTMRTVWCHWSQKVTSSCMGSWWCKLTERYTTNPLDFTRSANQSKTMGKPARKANWPEGEEPSVCQCTLKSKTPQRKQIPLKTLKQLQQRGLNQT